MLLRQKDPAVDSTVVCVVYRGASFWGSFEQRRNPGILLGCIAPDTASGPRCGPRGAPSGMYVTPRGVGVHADRCTRCSPSRAGSFSLITCIDVKKNHQYTADGLPYC